MKKQLSFLLSALALILLFSCNSPEKKGDGFVRVENGSFTLNGEPYEFVGANFWYGPILGSKGEGGDRLRLERELDSLQALGMTNLRVLVGAEGREGIFSHIAPILQKSPGEYDPDLLEGLDYFLAELEKRDMKAVLYLGNSWEWSGGFGTYLEWSKNVVAPDPSEVSWDDFQKFQTQFMSDDKAKAMYADHVKAIVSRTNSITRKPYSESPAIMAWQVANEPRAFSDEAKPLFAEWVESVAALIKSIDPNHLVSLGSEGLYGCQVDLDLWTDIHRSKNFDYGTIHVWPYNWNWITTEEIADGAPKALAKAREYIEMHTKAIAPLKKPLVIEEFGYPRDGKSYAKGSPVTGRDLFLKGMLEIVKGDSIIQGCNIWAWGGLAEPEAERWKPGAPYCGDPAQEPQGLYSIFATDTTTLPLLKTP